MSLVVANGAIYNRVVIPGKTRLLTPHRGTGQGGGIWLSPLCLSQLGNGQTVRSWREAACQSAASPPAGSPCSRVRPTPSCRLQGRSPFPCPCLALLSAPPGSVCWPRMPELLPVPAAEAGRRGSRRREGRRGRDGGFAQRGSASSLAVSGSQRCPAEPALPRAGFPQLLLSWSLRFAKEVLALGQRAEPALPRPHGHPQGLPAGCGEQRCFQPELEVPRSPSFFHAVPHACPCLPYPQP